MYLINLKYSPLSSIPLSQIPLQIFITKPLELLKKLSETADTPESRLNNTTSPSLRVHICIIMPSELTTTDHCQKKRLGMDDNA